ncbi:diguanylate cyclase [Shewanella sp. KX20019]|uniref:sensor domain-containing diguanylate cyclase n=1 Tax=Shewanella sp. KX20019 TaxID=2803864 RepID=UPI0019266043|nr:sensor domain-containing diguanylate cyclase [Shewanella sp. KX20019]QQX82386.1 diguanylate cyclase [Shewanella sp. KX20019]
MPFSKFRTDKDQLRFSKEQSYVWIEHSPVCTKVVDLDFNLQFMSSSGVKALAIKDVSEYYGKPYPFDFYPQPFRDEMSKNLIKSRDTGKVVKQEAAVVDTHGNEVWFQSTISPVREVGETGVESIAYLMVVSIDVTAQNIGRQKLEQLNDELERTVYRRTLELERTNQLLHHQAETDFLTDLPNRLAFDRNIGEHIVLAKRHKQSLSLLMVDVDEFKSYNDRYGHDIGDIVLKKVAAAIANTLVGNMDVAVRYGGEEFAVILPDMDAEMGFSIAEKVRRNVQRLKISDGNNDIIGNITVSIGVASLIYDQLNSTDIVKQADKALYSAKNYGRNNSQIYITD